MKLLGIINVDFDVIDQILMRYPVFVQYWRRSGTVHKLFTEYEVYESVRREVQCNILNELV